MAKQPLTPYSDLDNAAVMAELERNTQKLLEQQQIRLDAEGIMALEEQALLVQYAGIPTPLTELRAKETALKAELEVLKKAIAQGEAGLRNVIPDVVERRDVAEELGKGWQEQIGYLLAEARYRGIMGDSNEDVVLGHVEVAGKRHAMLARQIRNAQSWDLDATKLLASLPPERVGFFTFEAKPGHGDVSKKMCNEWLRRVIAEGNAPDGVGFAPMVLAKVGGDDPVYLVEVAGEEMSVGDPEVDGE